MIHHGKRSSAEHYDRQGGDSSKVVKIGLFDSKIHFKLLRSGFYMTSARHKKPLAEQYNTVPVGGDANGVSKMDLPNATIGGDRHEVGDPAVEEG